MDVLFLPDFNINLVSCLLVMGVLLKICLVYKVHYSGVLEADVVVFLHGGNLSLLHNPEADLDSGYSGAHLYHVDETSSAISKAALSKKMTNLTSFTCCGMKYIHKNDLFIVDCFPLLEELELSYMLHDDGDIVPLPKLRKIELFL
ncbi:GDSL esterase/lipase [Trifolium medium]|uniref:GDSL esterase/lipase n=1 Tax=Trifolium medium TaxID=97028 RepID=A0A392MKD7_9FABA|nr:GDSL esterase/lipase [Trifolium medium]